MTQNQPKPVWYPAQTDSLIQTYTRPRRARPFGLVEKLRTGYRATVILPDRTEHLLDIGYGSATIARRAVEDAVGYLADINRALATTGGHLSVGRGGFTLHYGDARLSGYDETIVLALARALKLPIIDTRTIPDDSIVSASLRAPLPAVNREPDPEPYHGLAYAPLAYMAAHYAQAGATIENLDLTPAQAAA